MADQDVSKPKEPPKPVHIGGESIVDRILPHIKKIMVTIVILAVVLTIVFAIRWIHDRKAIAETQKLTEVLTVADREVRGSNAPADPKKPDTFADSKARAAAVLDAIAKHDGEAVSGAFRAGLLFDSGKYDEAITEYKLCETKPALDGALCREGLGLALEAKASAEKDAAARQKGLEDSLAMFKTEQPDDTGPRAAYAHYHQARLMLLLGKPADAKTAFEKAKSLAPDSPELVDLIEKRLASMGAS